MFKIIQMNLHANVLLLGACYKRVILLCRGQPGGVLEILGGLDTLSQFD